jgi:hypothetical protein
MIRSAKLLLVLVIAADAQTPTPSPTCVPCPSLYSFSSSGTIAMSPPTYATLDRYSGAISIVDPDHVVITSKWEPCIVREGDHYIVRFHRR